MSWENQEMLNGILNRGWQLGVATLIALLLGGCASSHGGYSDFPAKETWLPAERSVSAEDYSHAAQFYRNPGFEGQWGSEAVAQVPLRESAIRHEVAAYQAMLGGDDDARVFHFLSAASDLNSPLTELYLWEATLRSLSAAQLNALVDLSLKIARVHPRQDARSYAARLAAGILKRRGQTSEQAALMDPLGWITNFKMVGSFDNDQGKGFLTEFGPETNADLNIRYQGALTKVDWRDVHVNAMSQVPLGDLFSPSSWSLAYLQTYVQSPIEQDGVLSLSTSDPTRVWLNEQLVGSDENVESSATDNFRVPVKLKKGWNRLLIKSANHYGLWRVGARFVDANGAPIGGLITQTSVPENVAVTESQSLEAAVSENHPLIKNTRAIKDPIRRQLLLARVLRMLGYSIEAHRAILELPSQSYGSVIVSYWAAMSFWDNGEQGKAIDLINGTLQANGENLPGFLLKRARFFKQKSLWERAIADLEHILELVPTSRTALISMADLLGQRGWEVDRCRVLDQVLTLWPDLRSVTLKKGQCMKTRGYYFDARTYYEFAHALEPKNTYGIRQLILLELDAINLERAEELAFQLTELEPWRPLRFLELGDIQRKAGKPGEAALSYEQAIELDPDWSQPHYRLGMMAYEDNATEKAIDHWKTSLKLNPTNSSLADHLDFVSPQGESVADQFIPSDEHIADLVKSSGSLSPSPASQVVDLLDHEITKVNSDGSSKRIVTRVAVAVSKRGRDELIVASVPRRGRVKLLQAYAVSSSGERQQSSSIRNGVIRYRSLEVGSVVVLQFVHYASSPAFLPNHYVGSWHFQGVHRENKESKWVLILPKNRKLNIYQTENVVLKKEELEEDIVYHFLSTDVPPLIAEPFTRPYIDLVRRVTVSTVADWDEYVQWERALLKDAFSEEGNIGELAKTITAGAKTPLEKIRKLFHYAAQEIRYQQDYENTIAGVKPHAAPVVIERGYGDCKDKAVLMIGLAKKLDIELRFAILRTTNAGRVIKETPNQQFNHAIVYVPKQDGINDGFFLDPTTDGLDMGNLRHDDQGAESLVFNPQDESYEFISIPYQKPTFQAHRYSIDINVKSETEAEANLRYSGRGTVAASARRILRNKEQAKKFYEKIGSRMFVASSVMDATVKNNDDIWEPLEFNLNLNISNSVQSSGTAYRLKLPQTFPLNRVVSLNSRTTPLYMGVPDTLDTTVKVQLPRGFGFKESPQNMKLDHKCFSFTRKIKQKRRSLEIQTNYTRSCVEITTEEYESFRDAVQKTAANTQDFILFES